MATSLSVLRALEMRKAKAAELESVLALRVSYTVITTASSTKVLDGRRLLTHDEFAAATKAHMDRITTLTHTVQELSRAINASNVSRMVTVGGKPMSIDQVLVFKKTSLVTKCSLLENLKHQATSTANTFSKFQAEYDKTLAEKEATITTNNANASAESLKSKIEGIRLLEEGAKPTILDPMGIEAVIATLDKEIRDFETEVNYTLVEANATTMIDVNI